MWLNYRKVRLNKTLVFIAGILIFIFNADIVEVV